MDGKLRSHSSAVPGGRSAPQIPLVAFVCWPRVTRLWKRQSRRGTHPAVRRCGVASSLQFLGFVERCTSGSDLKPKKKKNINDGDGAPFSRSSVLPCFPTVASKTGALQTGQSQGALPSARNAARCFIQRRG